MRKLIFVLMMLPLLAFGQKRMSVMVVPDDATPFGEVLQAGQIIVNAQTGGLYVAGQTLLSTATMASVGVNPLVVGTATTISGVDTSGLRLLRDQMFSLSSADIDPAIGIGMSDLGNAIVIESTVGGAITATPSIGVAPFNGKTIMLIGGLTANITFVDEANLAGSTLQLGLDTDFIMNTGDVLVLIYYDGYWYEVSRSKN